MIELARTQGHNIQGLSLGGGEPLLQKGLDVFLSHLNPATVSVMVTTNLSMEISITKILHVVNHDKLVYIRLHKGKDMI